ncbi:MAG: hypothetical protein DYG89_20065 [Caldilinea sp. CFX5]|nr:hypothetical protein [Caldilinea sp. CFX5]
MFVVPETFARDTIRREGEAGRQWIDSLPRLVDALCHRWNLVIDGAPLHGYLGVVIPVQRGTDACVLKVSWLDDSNADEALALTAWNGAGAVRLLAVEPALGAMLLERLDHRRSLYDLPVDEALVVAGRLLRRLAIPATVKLRSLPTLAAEIAHSLPKRWEQDGQPMSRHLLERACDLALRHGATAGNRLVNYDLHYDNVLAGWREPWLAVDPKVVIGDPEFGIMQLFMNRLDEIEATGGLDRHFAILVAAAELDETLARDWTLVRCVDYWLWGLSVGLTEDPKRCAAILHWVS